MPLSYRNQSINLPCKSIDWFLFGGAICRWWVNVASEDACACWKWWCEECEDTLFKNNTHIKTSLSLCPELVFVNGMKS